MTTQQYSQEEIHTVQRTWSRLWWAALIQGIIAVGLGLYTIFNPSQSPTKIVEILGLFIILDGIIDIIAAFVERDHIGNWNRHVLTGLFITIAGIVIISLAEFIAGITIAILIYIVAFVLLFSGLYSVVKALQMRDDTGTDRSQLFIAALKIAFALILFTQTKATATILVWFIGLFLLLLGAGLIFAAFRLRNMSDYIAPAMKNDVVEAHLEGNEVVVNGDPVDAPPEDLKELPDHVE